MRTNLSAFIAICIGVMLLSGGACPSNETTRSNRVAQTEIYQSYLITQTDQKFEVTAYFRIGGKTGTTLALAAPSTIKFNGQPMQEHLNTGSGTYYSATVPQTTTTGVFTFTDRENKTYTNKISLARVALGGNGIRTNGSAPFSLPVSGEIPETASLNLELNNNLVFVGNRPTDLNEAYYDSGTRSLVIKPAALKDVDGGNVAAELMVNNTMPTQQGTGLGGEISFTYSCPSTTLAYDKPRSKKSAAGSKTAK